MDAKWKMDLARVYLKRCLLQTQLTHPAVGAATLVIELLNLANQFKPIFIYP